MYWCQLRRQNLWHFTSWSNPEQFAVLSAGVCMRGAETKQRALKRASKGSRTPTEALLFQTYTMLLYFLVI